MERVELLRQFIAEKEKQIELYRAMIAEWKKELGEAGNNGAAEPTPRKGLAVEDGLLGVVRDYEFHGKSQPEAAKLFLERVGHPVKTQVIMDAIQKGGVAIGGKEESKKVNFYTILNRSRDFGRVARDTWGLLGWKGVSKKGTKEEVEVTKEAEA
jgi:hypothetical protein